MIKPNKIKIYFWILLSFLILCSSLKSIDLHKFEYSGLRTSYISIYQPTSSTVWNICDDEPETIQWEGWEGSGVDLYLYKGNTKIKWLGFYREGVSFARIWIDNSISPGSNYFIKAEDIGWEMDLGWSDAFTISCSGGEGYNEDDLEGEGDAIGYSTGANCQDIEVEAGYAFIADSVEGLVVIDVSEPLSPDTLNPIYEPLGCFTGEIVVSDDYAFLACGVPTRSSEFMGLSIIDISDPTNPDTPIKVTTDGIASNIYITESHAYLTLQTFWNSSAGENDGQQALAIIDITNPTNPGDPIYVPLNGYTYDIKVSHGYAYVGCKDEGIAILDVTNPNSPGTPSYILSDSERLRWLSVYGDLLYAAEFTSPGELFIYNISNPSNPQIVDSIPGIGSCNDFEVVGDVLYYTYSQYLKIVDISNYDAVKELSTKTVSADAKGFSVSGTYAFIADNGGGIKVFSINHLYEETTSNEDTIPLIDSYYLPFFYLVLFSTVGVITSIRLKKKLKI
ncbi:MAG: LVIVD repeat-containing protein [Promethearchaeota archaeon]